jgi:segregation and condensation protein B
VNDEDQPASLADQAAAWIPPWQRPAAPVVADGDGAAGDDEDEVQRPETDVAEVREPDDADVVADDFTDVAAGGSATQDPRGFTDGGVLEADEPGNFTEVAASGTHDPRGFTDGGVLDAGEPDDFTEVAGSGVHDLGDHTDVSVLDADQPDDFTEVAVSEGPGSEGPASGDFTEVAGLAGGDPGDVTDTEEPEAVDPRTFADFVGLGADEPKVANPAAARTAEVVEAERPANLAGALEAILLVVDEPVSAEVLAEVLAVPVDETNAALVALASQYTDQGRGFDLRRAAGGWRFYTRSEFASYVERFVLDGQSIRLTQAALETLAVIAYSQPVTRSRMSAIRGVNCDGVVRTLANRGLIEECGTQPDSGAFLYRTTDLFLEKLGLDSLVELPPLAPFLPDDVNGFADA